MQSPELIAALGKLIADLTTDPEMVKIVSTFLVTIASQPEVAEVGKNETVSEVRKIY